MKPRTSRDIWLHRAIRRKGRVQRYLRDLYGEKAFHGRDNIRAVYLNKAIKKVTQEKAKNRNNILQALNLAKRLQSPKGLKGGVRS